MIIPDSQFDAAAQSVAQPDTDPMDRAASQVAGDQKVRLRASLYSSLMANPDMAARAQRLGRKTGLPGDVVGRNLPEVERTGYMGSQECGSKAKQAEASNALIAPASGTRH